jgi:hypothetical protein
MSYSSYFNPGKLLQITILWNFFPQTAEDNWERLKEQNN